VVLDFVNRTKGFYDLQDQALPSFDSYNELRRMLFTTQETNEINSAIAGISKNIRMPNWRECAAHLHTGIRLSRITDHISTVIKWHVQVKVIGAFSVCTCSTRKREREKVTQWLVYQLNCKKHNNKVGNGEGDPWLDDAGNGKIGSSVSAG
jgi:hypothetical protein